MPFRDDEIELTVTLTAGSEPIRGSAALPGGEQRRFWGWLELVEIVQEALEQGPGSSSQADVTGHRPAA